MKYIIKEEIVPDINNFIYLSKYELQREFVEIKFPVRAIFFNNNIYPVEFLNSIKNYKKIEFILLVPENVIEFALCIIKTYYIQFGQSENDKIKLIHILKNFNIEWKIIEDMLEEYWKNYFIKNKDYYFWCYKLDNELIEILLENDINFRTLYEIKDKIDLYKNIIKKIIKNFKPNNNTFKNIITYINDIYIRDNILPEEIYNKCEPKNILDLQMTIFNKLNKFMENLEKIRYPVWSEKKLKLKKLIDYMFSKYKINIEVSKYFEGDNIIIKYNIKNKNDINYLENNIKNIKKDFEQLIKELEND